MPHRQGWGGTANQSLYTATLLVESDPGLVSDLSQPFSAATKRTVRAREGGVWVCATTFLDRVCHFPRVLIP
jgi:hypothetical protein